MLRQALEGIHVKTEMKFSVWKMHDIACVEHHQQCQQTRASDILESILSTWLPKRSLQCLRQLLWGYLWKKENLRMVHVEGQQ